MSILPQGLIIDSFAGGGGASTGIEMALGRSPDIAINHDAEAIAMHAANHPNTKHYSKNIWQFDPLAEIGHRPVLLAWFSPDCKHFSKAKGGKPVKRNIRDLAWVVVRFARQVRPAVIMLENVEEFQGWGPLVRNEAGELIPCKARKGETFKRWAEELRRLGYACEWRELRARDYGAPTIRKRFFMVARRDGFAISWPKPTHGDPESDAVKSGDLKPWRSAAEIIDWSLPCPSIFLTREEGRALGVNRPLAEATMARIAKGVQRYVIEAARPFLVNLIHQGSERTESVDEPFRTVTDAHRGEKAVVAPYLVPRYSERVGQDPRSLPIDAPTPTIVPTSNGASLVAAHLTKFSENSIGITPAEPLHTAMAGAPRHGVVAAFLAQHNNNRGSDPHAGHPADAPISTVTSQAQQGVIASHMLSLHGSDLRDAPAGEPLRTIAAGGGHAAQVAAFLMKYHSLGGQHSGSDEPLHTVDTRDRHGLVTVSIEGEPYIIVDIGMRMLTPRELFRAQGFPEDYAIAPIVGEKPLTKTAQIRMCGNSVCPQVAEALVRANLIEMPERRAPRRSTAPSEMPLWPEDAPGGLAA